MTSSFIRPFKGNPCLFINGQPVPAVSAYVKPEHIDRFKQADVTLFTSLFSIKWWIGPDRYDFSELDAQVSEYADHIRNGYLMPRIDFAPAGYPWWGQANPTEMVVLRNIETSEIMDPAQSDPRGEEHLHHGVYLKGLNLHSFHSVKWREDASRAIAVLIHHAESQPYADRIWGWHLCDGWPQEWFHWGEYLLNGLEDYSPAAENDFQRWLRKTYQDDEKKLQRAWGEVAHFEEIKVPWPTERVRTSHGEFYDPVRDRRTIDYTQCMTDSMVDSIIAVCQAAKEAMKEPKVICTFYGYPFCHLPRPQLIGHNALARLLDSPAVDLLASPHSYDYRGYGGYHSPQGMADSARRAHKMHFDEVDCKTIWTPKVRWKDHISVPTSVEGTIEMMKKDAAYHIASSSGMWWCDLMDQGWYDRQECVELIRKMKAIEAKLIEIGRSNFGEVALVVSERSQMFQAQKDGLIDASREMFRNWSLSRMGAPFEQLLVSDLACPGIPHYKLYIMADAYYLSADDRELIGRTVECDGATILWFYAPGFLDDRSAELANMEAITGIHFGKQDIKDELNVSLSNYDHPVTAGLPQGMRYGTGIKRDLYERPPRIQFLPDTRVSLAFYADDPQVFVLGLLESTGKPGLVIKDLGTWRSIYSAAPVLSWTLLRNIARWAGVHLYNDIGDMVWGNDRFLAVYSQSEGVHPIFFPRAVNVEDAYRGENLGIGVRRFDLTMKQWETRLLLFRD
jgi:hypothetical protein